MTFTPQYILAWKLKVYEKLLILCLFVFRFIEVSLEDWTNAKQAEMISAGVVRLEFRPFLKWLDRNLEGIVTGALKQVDKILILLLSDIRILNLNYTLNVVFVLDCTISKDDIFHAFSLKSKVSPICKNSILVK